MKLLVTITVLMILGRPVFANDESPSLEMLLFLAEFFDEHGNWDGPPIEDEFQDNEMNEGEQYD